MPELVDTLSCVRLLRRVWPSRRVEGSRPALGSHQPAGKQIGRFRIVRQLGSGGFGVVFLAVDPALNRPVALKVPRAEVLVDPALRRRFAREARVAAGLNHPHIAAVFETGEADGVCYIASAYCGDATLGEWLRTRSEPVPFAQAAELVMRLADALAHAHDHGILHRDLKPSNVILEFPSAESDSVPRVSRGIPFTPRIVDFGLAMLLEDSEELTRSNMPMGTASYMAPEQARGDRLHIDERVDVYGLGAVLYELIAGQPPFRGESFLDTIKRVERDEPVWPRQLRPRVPRDLEAVCLRCLEKNPVRRYATAAELAADLRRFLAGEPTRARALPAWHRALRWMRRRPAVAGLAALAVVTLVGAGVGAAWHFRQLYRYNEALVASVAREKTRSAELDFQARQQLYGSALALAGTLGTEGRRELLWNMLNVHRPEPGQPDFRGFEWRYLWALGQSQRALTGHPSTLVAIASADNGRSWVSLDLRRTLIVWDTATGRVQRRVQLPDPSVGALVLTRAACFGDGSRSGLRCLSVCDDAQSRPAQLRLWDVSSGQLLAQHTSEVPVGAFAMAPDGSAVAYAALMAPQAEGELRLWLPGTETLRVLRSLRHVAYNALCFSPDGKTLAASVNRVHGPDPGLAVELIDLGTGRDRWRGQGHTGWMFGLAFSPDGRLLASGSWDDTVRLWDVATGREHTRLPIGHDGDLLAFSPDSKVLAVGTSTRSDSEAPGLATRWNVKQGRPLEGRLELPRGVAVLAYGCDGRTVGIGTTDLIHVWEPDMPSPARLLTGHAPEEAWGSAFLPDGKTLVTCGDNESGAETVRFWDTASGEPRGGLRGHDSLVWAVAVSPDGRLLATASHDGTARLWELPAGRERCLLQGHTDQVRCLAFSPDGRRLATGSRDRTIRLWDVATGRHVSTLTGHERPVGGVAFLRDGRVLASSGGDGTVRLWDVESGAHRVIHATVETWRVVHSPDGTLLATCHGDGRITLLDSATGAIRGELRGHAPSATRTIAFAPDGKTLASGGSDGTIRFWQCATGLELLAIACPKSPINSVSFSPDGRVLAAVSLDGSLRLFSAVAP